MPPKTKKKPGPAPKPPGERAVVVSTKVPPAIRDQLTAIGGTLTAGLKRAALELCERNPGTK